LPITNTALIYNALAAKTYHYIKSVCDGRQGMKKRRKKEIMRLGIFTII